MRTLTTSFCFSGAQMLLGAQSVRMRISKHKGRNTSISHLNSLFADIWKKSAFKFWIAIRASPHLLQFRRYGGQKCLPQVVEAVL